MPLTASHSSKAFNRVFDPEALLRPVLHAAASLVSERPIAYRESVLRELAKALSRADRVFSTDCSIVLIRDDQNPERLVLSTSSAKSTVFGRKHFSVESPFIKRLALGQPVSEITLDRRSFWNDELWELLWQSMTVGAYTEPWSVLGAALFPHRSSSTDTVATDPLAYLICVGPQGWASEIDRGSWESFANWVSTIANLVDSIVRELSQAERVSHLMENEFVTAGKLHGVLAPLQRLELKLRLIEMAVLNSRPTKEFMPHFDTARREINESKLSVLNFLDARGSQNAIGKATRQDANQQVNLLGCIEQVIENFQELAQSKRKTFVLRVNPQIRVAISSTDLEHIVSNLVHNAIKYGSEFSKIKIGCETHGCKAKIVVTSHGIPIRPTDQDKIFEPGFRTSDARRIEYTAAGLGLFTSRYTAEIWGGHLYLRGSFRETDGPDSGRYRTTFCLSLPLPGK